MQLFYAHTAHQIKQIVEIQEQEHIHLAKSLRKQVGDEVFIVNGNGQLFKALVLAISKKSTSVELLELIKESSEKSNLTIAIAPTKQLDRYDWFIEKSIELGIGSIQPFFSQNSERRILKLEKIKLKVIAALKQSLRLSLPSIMSPEKLEDVLNKSKDFEVKLIAYTAEKQLSIKDFISTKKTIVLIGPEGGFTKMEVKKAQEKGFIPISLGENRLRTETAGVFTASLFYAQKL